MDKEQERSAPLVSVIIPSFNRAYIISETLDSLIMQSHRNWECIIIDDGSADDTEKLVNSYIDKDIRFSFFKRQRLPKGANTCRNIGIEQANGDFLMFLDSDDMLLENCLQERVKNIEGKDCVFNEHLIVSAGTPLFCREGLKEIHSSQGILIAILKAEYPINISSFLIKKAVLHSSKLFFDENLRRLQDVDFNISLLSLLDNSKSDIIKTPDFVIRRANSGGEKKDRNSTIVNIKSHILFIEKQLLKRKIYEELYAYFRYNVFECVKSIIFNVDKKEFILNDFRKETEKWKLNKKDKMFVKLILLSFQYVSKPFNFWTSKILLNIFFPINEPK